MTESFSFRYEITPSAVTDAARLHQSTFLARYRLVMVLIAAVGIVLATVVDLSTGMTVFLFGLAMLAATWMQFLDRWLFRNRARGVVGGTSEYVVDDEGIHYTNPLGSGVFAWSALTDVRANDKTIAFGRDRVLVAYVPTTAFASPAERDSFLGFARARVGQAAAKA